MRVRFACALCRERARALPPRPAPANPRPPSLPPTSTRLTEYLYNLAEVFNQFFGECRVMGSEQEASRTLLAEATARVMRQCFELLGITPLYRI